MIINVHFETAFFDNQHKVWQNTQNNLPVLFKKKHKHKYQNHGDKKIEIFNKRYISQNHYLDKI